jgi:SAM-dependent methyltransferase
MPRGRSVPWTRTVFVDHAATYAEVLRSAAPAAAGEVHGLVRILRQEGIEPGSRVIDIACGIGRHVVPLAKQGYPVVGCDLSPGFIRHARRWAREERLTRRQAHFYVADYRRLGATIRAHAEEPFSAAICLFTSSGFEDPRSDRAVFSGLRRVVRPGGLFVVEMGDRDSILRRFQEFGLQQTESGIEIHERRTFDPERSLMHSVWRAFRRDRTGHLRRLYETELRVRLYSLHELKELLHDAGWVYRRAYGSLATLEPVSMTSRRLAVVVERPR